jgi:hypothetical protein
MPEMRIQNAQIDRPAQPQARIIGWRSSWKSAANPQRIPMINVNDNDFTFAIVPAHPIEREMQFHLERIAR